jgi:hypothetical protein
VAALAGEHATPELVGVGVEDVVDPRGRDEPVLALELGVELARAPARVAGEDPHPLRRRHEIVELAAVTDEPDVLDHADAGLLDVVELGEHEQRVGLDGPTAVDDGVVAGQLREVGRRLADDQLAGMVEHQAQRTLLVVLADEHDAAGEVRVRQRRAGDEQLSTERVDPDLVPVSAQTRPRMTSRHAYLIVSVYTTCARGTAGSRWRDGQAAGGTRCSRCRCSP